MVWHRRNCSNIAIAESGASRLVECATEIVQHTGRIFAHRPIGKAIRLLEFGDSVTGAIFREGNLGLDPMRIWLPIPSGDRVGDLRDLRQVPRARDLCVPEQRTRRRDRRMDGPTPVAT